MNRAFFQRWMLDGNIWQRWAKNFACIFPISLLITALLNMKAMLSHAFTVGHLLFSSIFLSVGLGLTFALRYSRDKTTFSYKQ